MPGSHEKCTKRPRPEAAALIAGAPPANEPSTVPDPAGEVNVPAAPRAVKAHELPGVEFVGGLQPGNSVAFTVPFLTAGAPPG